MTENSILIKSRMTVVLDPGSALPIVMRQLIILSISYRDTSHLVTDPAAPFILVYGK